MAEQGKGDAADDPRVRLAGERTLLAWIRTGLALMGFGFVVARFGLFLHELAATRPGATPPSTGVSLGIGTTLVLLGVAVNLLAAWQHRQLLHSLESCEPYRSPAWSLAIIVAMVLAAVGMGMTAYLLLSQP